jgi:hypothetical protein
VKLRDKKSPTDKISYFVKLLRDNLVFYEVPKEKNRFSILAKDLCTHLKSLDTIYRVPYDNKTDLGDYLLQLNENL